MRRVLILIVMMFFGLCLVGCKETQEKVNVHFKIDGTSHLVIIDKGSMITKDIIPLQNEDGSFELYYDSNCKDKYIEEPIYEDIVLYVKNLNNEEEIILKVDISYIENIYTAIVIESLYSSNVIAIDNEKIFEIFQQFFVGLELTNDSDKINSVYKNSFHNDHFSITFNGDNPFSISIFNDGTIMFFINEDDVFVSNQNSVINLKLLKEKLR